MRIGVSQGMVARAGAVAAVFLATAIGAHGAVQDSPDLRPAKAPLAGAPQQTHGSVSFIQIDMNFDGRKDLAVVQQGALTSEPLVIYFLYDESKNRYSRHAALGKLLSPEFDARSKRVKTGWRTSGTRKISDTYGWSSNQLKLIERKELDLKTQACVSIRYGWVNDTKWKIGQRTC